MARKFGIFTSLRLNAAQKRWVKANGGGTRLRAMIEDARTGQGTLLTGKARPRKVSPTRA